MAGGSPLFVGRPPQLHSVRCDLVTKMAKTNPSSPEQPRWNKQTDRELPRVPARIRGKAWALDHPAIRSRTVAERDQANVAAPRRAVDRHDRVLGGLDPIEHPILVDEDLAPARDVDPRQGGCFIQLIVVLGLIEIGLDAVNETGRPEADPAKP
jgi:hypothetical protein